MIYDVIIVGTGPSAAACHNAIVSKYPKINLCILEAGKLREEYAGQFSVKSSENFKLSPSTYLGFGGTSELWHSVLAPLDKIDFEYRPEISSPAWPISLDELQPYYRKVLKFLGVANENIFDEEELHFSLKQLDLQDLEKEFCPKLFIQLKRRWKASTYWNSTRPEIKFEHFVKGVELTKGMVRVVSYDFQNKPNEPHHAKKVIICAGALNTPQIIYNSDMSEIARNNVGACILDHPMAVGMQIKRNKKYNFDILTSLKERSINKKIAFRLKDVVQREEALPNSSFFFRPSFSEGFSQNTEKLKSQLLSYRDFIKKKRFPVALTLELIKNLDVISQVISYKTGLLSTVDLFDIFCVTEQIDRGSSIYFEKDKNGFFKGHCEWSVGDLDGESNLTILNKFVDWSNNSSPSNLVTVYPEEVDWQYFATSAAHHIGTAPMAAKESEGALDSNGCLFGSNSSIFVADSSVMPSAGCANVTLTSMALAVRVGELVAETF